MKRRQFITGSVAAAVATAVAPTKLLGLDLADAGSETTEKFMVNPDWVNAEYEISAMHLTPDGEYILLKPEDYPMMNCARFKAQPDGTLKTVYRFKKSK